MKKLMDLLQGVMTQRKDAPPLADKAPSRQNGLPHPVAPFAQVRLEILQKLASRKTPEETATLMAAELAAYFRDVLRPWLASQSNPPLKPEIAEKLIPRTDAEIVGYLVPLPGGSPVFTAEDILDQIGAELEEAFREFDNKGLSQL